MILLGDLYRVIVAACLLQLYPNRSPLLEYVGRGSPLKYVVHGSPLGHLLGHPVKA